MKVRIPLIAFVVLGSISIAVGVKYDMESLMQDAKNEIMEELKQITVNGASSRRFARKKVTQFSRAMDDRNKLFRKVHKLLMNEGASHEEARQLVKEELRRGPGGGGGSHPPSHESGGKNNGGGRRPNGGAGGQGGQTPPVILIDDLCEGTHPTCDESTLFREITGQCNNLLEDRTLWGSMTISMRREIPAIDDLYQIATYNDLLIADRQGYGVGGGSTDEGTVSSCDDCTFSGFGVDRKECSCSAEVCASNANLALPNARLVSAVFHADSDIPDTKATHMVTQMGQFLDHDITLTPETEAEECCVHPEADSNCFPITIPSVDSFYSSRVSGAVRCLEFTRSTAFCEGEEEERQEDSHHEQINGITAFVDASNVYSSDLESLDALRLLDGSGKLKTGDNDLLPVNPDTTEEFAGDVRAREMPGLSAMHTLFLREHNRVCDLIAAEEPNENEEYYFENARRIVIAEMQNIVYGEYLPVVLGEDAMRDAKIELKEDSKYDENVDPSILNSFATAAYRFGHSMIQGIIKMYTEAGVYQEEYPLSENYFNLEKYHANEGLGMEKILMGLVTQPAQTNDRHVTTETTNLLFPEEGADFGGDLIARNIQRGRDHGLPSYVAFYDFYFGQPKNKNEDMDCWDHKPITISQTNWDLLSTIYAHPHHIDLFVGGLAEDAVSGGLTGAVFNAIKAKQFKNLMDGDRFFFTHEDQIGSFTRDAQRHIMDRQLSDILCENTNLEKVSSNVFQVHDREDNRYKTCSTSTTDLDITKINLLK